MGTAAWCVMSVGLVRNGVEGRYRVVLPQHARLRLHARTEDLPEIGQYIVGAGPARGRERPTYIVRLAIRDQILHLIWTHAAIEPDELADDGILERNVGSGRKPLHAVPATQHRRLGKTDE